MRHPRAHGWTLTELLLVAGVLALLSLAASAGWQSVRLRQHRLAAVQALVAAEAAQGRWRAAHVAWTTRWGDGGLGLPPTSADGRWAFAIDDTDTPEQGVRLRALAQGPQREDAACRELALLLSPQGSEPRSGTDARLANGAAENRRCWGLP